MGIVKPAYFKWMQKPVLLGIGRKCLALQLIFAMGFAGAQQLSGLGQMQQQYTQQQLDAIRNLPLEQQQIINQALGLNVGGGSGQTSTSTSRQGLLGVLGL
jgi:hypothetical protein